MSEQRNDRKFLQFPCNTAPTPNTIYWLIAVWHVFVEAEKFYFFIRSGVVLIEFDTVLVFCVRDVFIFVLSLPSRWTAQNISYTGCPRLWGPLSSIISFNFAWFVSYLRSPWFQQEKAHELDRSKLANTFVIIYWCLSCYQIKVSAWLWPCTALRVVEILCFAKLLESNQLDDSIL